MLVQTIDARGLKCPQPVLKIIAVSIKMKAGDIIEILGDCATFEKDLKDWCRRSKKILMWIKEEAGSKKAQILF